MPLQKTQNILDNFSKNDDIKVIYVKTDSLNFQKRFNGTISNFFRNLKNSLCSFQGISNRKYFAGFSGVYFFEENGEAARVAILFDASIENLNDTQVKTRIRKLMGFNTEIKIGRFDEFSSEIFEMAKIKATQQTFGKYYFQNKKKT